MNGKLHILTVPPGPAMTVRLLEEYTARTRPMGASLWLAPTERAAAEIDRKIARSGQPLLAPATWTLRGLAEAISATVKNAVHPGSRSERRRWLEQVVNELGRSSRLHYFRRVLDTRGFLNAAAGTLDELAVLGVDSELLGNVDFGSRAAKLSAVVELFREYVRSEQGFDPIRNAAEVSRAGLPPPFHEVQSVFIDGFDTFTPVEWSLVDSLSKNTELWVSLPDGGDDRAESFTTIRETRSRLFELSAGEQIHVVPGGSPRRPPALEHLARSLFSPVVPPATDATGLSLIEAAGSVGEARLVARRIRAMLADGVRPGDIVVTTRELDHSIDLFDEVFTEYGIPLELDGNEPLIRTPVVSTLLRALRLPEEGWQFAEVTALLRSTYFCPAWCEGDANLGRRAEGLLRQLGVAKHRESYLRAVELWSETPPDGLEDEQPEESRRRRKARLAAECRPFLERFFRAWDVLPAEATPARFLESVWSFAAEFGFVGAAQENHRDRLALDKLHTALSEWSGPKITLSAYVRGIIGAAASEELPRSSGRIGRVRVLSARQARHVQCDHLFILGLGERGFPSLNPPTSLLDDVDRIILRRAGIPLPDPARRLADEQLLFLQLVARPCRELILSYPAVDEKGQSLLPGSFLQAVRDAFRADSIPCERQRMLIEGYTNRAPLSVAEARVQFAVGWTGGDGSSSGPGIPREIREHLEWSREMAAARFHSREFSRYDGAIDEPSAQRHVRKYFGADRVFSPTTLETYIACPFRFLLGQVLQLEELEEPGEEVENTRRGAAYHRALSRLHQRLQESDPEFTRSVLPDTIGTELLGNLDRAVMEYAARAPGAASRKLWELEGKRLHRSAVRYRDHWEKFLEPWRKVHTFLDPQLLEADFGLPGPASPGPSEGNKDVRAPLIISVGGVEVRIGGRIDRVDVAEVDGGIGFWVIDYKTGRATSYTASELLRFEKLQLPLYAMAVERVFFPAHDTRPLGLAYWLVTDSGPKAVMPTSKPGTAWLADSEAWRTFRTQLETWVAAVVDQIRGARFPLAPRSENCTDNCPYARMCRITQSRGVGKLPELTSPAFEGTKPRTG